MNTLRTGLALGGSEQFPKFARIEGAHRQMASDVQEIAIGGQENVRVAGHGGRDDSSIRRIANHRRRRRVRLGNNGERREHRVGGLDAIRAEP
jgi:hypothetical protein